MICHWLTVFGVPRTICSDRGHQFTGGCLKAMCSSMGTRHAKNLAYLSPSNGGAEVAVRQLFQKLRRIHLTNKRRNSLEEMWPAFQAHHDTPTPGGLSPHQILFSRDPWAGDFPCEMERLLWMAGSSLRGRRLRRGRFANSLRNSITCIASKCLVSVMPCAPRPPLWGLIPGYGDTYSSLC